MDYFESALNSLTKTQHKRRLIQILLVIRKATSGPQQYEKITILSNKGSLKYIVGLLQNSSFNVVNTALSILGNCCMNTQCSKDLMTKFHIASILCNILDKYDQDCIRGRIFRIIGNLSYYKVNVEIEGEGKAIVKKIVDFLQKVCASFEIENIQNNSAIASEATINMALRALRKIILNNPFIKFGSNNEMILKTVGRVLLKFSSIWEKSQDYQNIIQEALGLIYKYPQAIADLKNTGDGDALTCLSKLVLVYPAKVVKIIMNFTQYSSLKSDLPVMEIFQKFIEALNDLKMEENLVKDSERYCEYLRGLRKLVEHPGYVENVRETNLVSHLIEILRHMRKRNKTTLKFTHLILSILTTCTYSNGIVLMQIQCGIIPVLIEKLEWIFGSSTIINSTHNKRKANTTNTSSKKYRKDITKKPSCLIGNGIHIMESFDLVEVNSFRHERSSSPSSSSDISSPNSPNYTLKMDEELSDSDNYSPVCSDADEIECSVTSHHTEEQSVSDQEDCPKKCYKNFVLDSATEAHVQEGIYFLINSYITLTTPIIELANPKLLIVLMNGALAHRSAINTPFQLVSNILNQQSFLIPLMLSDFIPMVYDLTITDHNDTCWKCFQVSEKSIHILSKFTHLAESGYGKGEIAHLLLRGTCDIKEKIVLVIPYIIRNKGILSKLMLNCGALNILMKLLVKTSDHQQKSIKGLCALSIHQLKIKSPTSREISKETLFDVNRYELPENCSKVVFFKLDDGLSIGADRDFLSEKSTYFNCLLTGSFKESHEKEIVLHNVASESFLCLLNLLHYEVSKLELLPLNVKLETLLDVISLTDRYILEELSVYLAGCVEQFLISSKTVPLIYQWSIESHTNILRVESVAFALAANISESERVEMFQNLFDLGYSEFVIEDMQKLLTRFLK